MKTPSASRVVPMTQLVMPAHTNGAAGVLFGGVVMQWIDVCVGLAAMKHAGRQGGHGVDRSPGFLSPIHLGDIVILQAQVNLPRAPAWRWAAEWRPKIPRDLKRRYTTKAYLTFVAIGRGRAPRR